MRACEIGTIGAENIPWRPLKNIISGMDSAFPDIREQKAKPVKAQIKSRLRPMREANQPVAAIVDACIMK